MYDIFVNLVYDIEIEEEVVNNAPTAPDSLLCEGQTNPTNVIDTTPEFSAVGHDPDTGDTLTHYDIEVDDDSEFGSTIWHSGKTDITDFTENTRCADISYAGSSLTGETTYYWRIKFWDDDDAEGAWSTETATFSVTYSQPVFKFEGMKLKGIKTE